ncbi:YicC/YloC family endoribonuclease [Mucilaginibacter sp.]
MTGYGIATLDFGNTKYTVEIKSLNSKFLELSLRLPKVFSDKEFQLRTECNKQIERGKVNLSINAEQQAGVVKAAGIDTVLLKNYYEQLKAVSIELGEPTSNLMQLALGLPEVVKYDEETVSEDAWKVVEKAFNQAVAAFQKFRADEGNVLEQDLKYRINIILENLKLVEIEEPKRVPVIRERLNTFLQEAAGREAIVDQNRFEQELIYYIDKLDITEEKIRLKTHCDYFVETLKNADANGKKLGFIAQEIGREVNTLGSKANDANMQKLVVGMKEELEKIKEQLLNVL